MPVAAPFAFAIGINMANRNTPTSGPDVAELVSMAHSMTPDISDTMTANPSVIMQYSTPKDLMAYNCLMSATFLKAGICDTKSSHVTVANEFVFDTAKL